MAAGFKGSTSLFCISCKMLELCSIHFQGAANAEWWENWEEVMKLGEAEYFYCDVTVPLQIWKSENLSF